LFGHFAGGAHAPHLPCEDEDETGKSSAVPGTGPILQLSLGSILQQDSS